METNMPLTLTDTHAHLNDDAFNDDRDEIIAELERSLKFVIVNGSDFVSSYNACTLAKRHGFIYATAGLHPHDAKDYDEAYENKLAALLTQPKCVAVGEIGLDYHYDLSPRDTQRSVFVRQLALADKYSKPVTIHSREAAQDTFDILKAHMTGRRGGVLHSFSQSKEMLKKYLDLNMYFSISGVVTFKNAESVRETVSYIPMDRLFIETDSPYMTPVPFRGKRNIPSYTRYVAEKIAEIKGLTYESVCDITMRNAQNFFDIVS